MLAMILFIFGLVSRLIVHLPNFTPVIALALFGGVYLQKKQAVLFPVVLLAVSDILLGGFHSTILFTWGTIALIALLGLWVRKNKSSHRILGTSLLSAVLFYVITNFGVWLVDGMYPLTLNGLAQCYYAAVPFFRYSLLSTLVYTVILFGGYELMAAQIRKTRFAASVL